VAMSFSIMGSARGGTKVHVELEITNEKYGLFSY